MSLLQHRTRCLVWGHSNILHVYCLHWNFGGDETLNYLFCSYLLYFGEKTLLCTTYNMKLLVRQDPAGTITLSTRVWTDGIAVTSNLLTRFCLVWICTLIIDLVYQCLGCPECRYLWFGLHNVFGPVYIGNNGCYRAEVGTIFCLSWLITWYGHVLEDTKQTVRLYDFFLASHPLMPIYLAAAASCILFNIGVKKA